MQKAVDERLTPLREEITEKFRAGGPNHCGDPNHHDPCVKNPGNGLHFQMNDERITLVASIALRKSSTDYMKLLPLGSRGFKPDQARNFHTANVSSDSPGFSSMGPAGMMPGMGSLLNPFMAMAQMQMQMQMHMAQQQQMLMQNMGSNGNGHGPSFFNAGMLHLLSCSNKPDIL